MPVQPPESPEPPERWSADRALGLAPDAAVGQAARVLSGSGRWREAGHATEPPGLWGLVRGSGRTPYQVCVDLAEPAYRCTCPSRKIPCKHAVGLLLLWSDGGVPTTDPPAWFTEWLAERDARRQRAAARAEGRTSRVAATDDEPTATQLRRSARVDAGIDELERWLADQVRSGIAGAGRAGYRHWDAMAERLVDAQAPALASGVRRLAAYAGTPDRLLAELGLLRLAVVGWRRREQLPADVVDNVRGRLGFPVSADDVLAGAPVRDEWTVIGIRDELDRRLSLRRAWLRGVGTGRDALVLSFAPPGVPLAGDLLLGTSIDADLCFYPGRGNLRALVRARHGDPRPAAEPPGATATVAQALHRYASSLADNPWQDRVPMLLTAVRLAPAGAGTAADGRWHLLDADGAALPLYPPAERPWRLLAAAGGEPATIAGEWTADGLRPLAMWVDGRLVVP